MCALCVLFFLQRGREVCALRATGALDDQKLLLQHRRCLCESSLWSAFASTPTTLDAEVSSRMCLAMLCVVACSRAFSEWWLSCGDGVQLSGWSVRSGLPYANLLSLQHYVVCGD